MEEDKTTQEDRKLRSVWEANKEKVQSENENEFIIFNERELQDAGVSRTNLKAPGNFTSGFNQGGEKRFFLREFGKGRFKLFRGF